MRTPLKPKTGHGSLQARAGLRAEVLASSLHDLRHTFASLLIAAGVGIKRVQTLLGHSSARLTLDVYAHLLPDHDDGAAEKLAALIKW